MCVTVQRHRGNGGAPTISPLLRDYINIMFFRPFFLFSLLSSYFLFSLRNSLSDCIKLRRPTSKGYFFVWTDKFDLVSRDIFGHSELY